MIHSFAKYSSNGPSSRYRIYQFHERFRRAGIRLDVHPLFDDHYFEILRQGSGVLTTARKVPYVLSRFANRLSELRGLPNRLVHIEHQLFPYVPFEVESAFLPQKYLLEFDDSIFLTHPRKLPRLISGATAVIAGNKVLAEYASRFQPEVHVVPTVLDTDLFRPQPRSENPQVTIGWSGLEYNFKYLRMMDSVLKKMSDRRDVKIVILSGSRPEQVSFPLEFVQWEPSREFEQMNCFDIGIMPLEMNEWCRGKCGIKLLQYMSVGVASVATPIGVNSEIIVDGVNGFLAETIDQWEARLNQLINDQALRKRMGDNARETVTKSYSVAAWFPRLLEIYRKYL